MYCGILLLGRVSFILYHDIHVLEFIGALGPFGALQISFLYHSLNKTF